MKIENAPNGYKIFNEKEANCIKDCAETTSEY
jgi:hypothetical protein